MQIKKCSSCKIEKPTSCFSSNKSRGDGLSHICKECAKYNREKRKNDNIRNYFIDVIRTSKGVSKKRGINNFNIDVEYLESLYKNQNGLCAISGIKMTHTSGKGKIATNVSIDRIDNSKGYTKDNIQLLCQAINMLKFNMTNSELELFLLELSKNISEKY